MMAVIPTTFRDSFPLTRPQFVARYVVSCTATAIRARTAIRQTSSSSATARPPMKLISTLLVAVAMVASVGCGPQSESSIETSVGPVYGERIVESSEVQAEYRKIRDAFRASEDRFAECVLGLGFEYSPRILEVSLPESGTLATTLDLRRQFGYGIVDGEGNTGITVSMTGGSVPESQVASFRDEVLQTAGGCMEFYFVEDVQEILFNLRFEGSAPPQSVLNDVRIAEAQVEWANCMRRHGYPYSTRSGPFEDIEQRLADLDRADPKFETNRAELLALEIRIATTDVECHLAEVDPVVRSVVADHD